MNAVVVTLAPLLRDIFTSLMGRHLVLNVIEIVDERDDGFEAIARHSPDLAIIGLRNDESRQTAFEIRSRSPGHHLLLIAADGREAYLLSRDGRGVVLTDISAQSLGSCLRSLNIADPIDPP